MARRTTDAERRQMTREQHNRNRLKKRPLPLPEDTAKAIISLEWANPTKQSWRYRLKKGVWQVFQEAGKEIGGNRLAWLLAIIAAFCVFAIVATNL